MSNRSAQPIDEHIGRRLKRRRERLDWTQQKLAEKLGVKFQQVQKYEAGQNRIAAGRLYEIAKLLRVPLLYFFEGFEPEAAMPPPSPPRAFMRKPRLGWTPNPSRREKIGK